MFFYSAAFFAYFVISAMLFQRTPDTHKKSVLILISLIFYASFEPIFLIPIVLVTLLNFAAGRFAHKNIYLFPAIFFNLLFLFTIKFSEGMIYPLGISYYIFQNISYLIDVKEKVIKVEKNIFNLFLYNIYLPRVIAGPVERYGFFAEQINNLKRVPEESIRSGLLIFLFGLMKKYIVADRLAAIIDLNYFQSHPYDITSGILYFLGACMMVYFNFCAYSDMAYGISRVFGIEITRNFESPFTAETLGQLWKRWHVSLYRWLGEVVIPQLYSRKNNEKNSSYRGFFIVICFSLSGFWHARFGPIVWGIYAGVTMLLQELVFRRYQNIPVFLKRLSTLAIFAVSGMLFCLESWSQARNLTSQFVNKFDDVLFFKNLAALNISISDLSIVACFSLVFIFIDYLFTMNRNFFSIENRFLNTGLYLSCFMFLALFSFNNQTYFMYSKF